MKPPICEVCTTRFSPKAGALVSCVGDGTSAAWDQRQAEGSFPGHPPNKGWFCSSHLVEAKKLSVLLTLPQVIASIRGEALVTAMSDRAESISVATPRAGDEKGSQARPTTNAVIVGDDRTCDICGITFDKATAGRVDFENTPEGIEWHRTMIYDGVTGTNPDHAWLCARHVGPALWVSSTLTRSEAMVELMPLGREPLEYDEKPPSADPDAPFPQRPSFRPVVDDGLSASVDHWIELAPQTPKAVHAAVHAARQEFGVALGVTELRNNGSTGSASTDPADTRWAAEGMWVGAGFTPHQAGDAVVFVIRQGFRDGDRRGPIVREGLRLLIQRREQSLFELTFVPADAPTVALDGLVMLERIFVRASPLLDDETAQALNSVVSGLASTLAVEPEDALTLVPDLVDVDLGSGVVVRKRFGIGSTVAWNDVGPSMDGIHQAILDSIPAWFDFLGLGAVPELEHSTDRTWSPMDGAQPPDCPFEDRTKWSAAVDGIEVAIRHRSTHWSEESVSGRSVSLLIHSGGAEPLVSLSAVDACDGSPVSLTLSRPTTAGVVSTVRSIFHC